MAQKNQKWLLYFPSFAMPPPLKKPASSAKTLGRGRPCGSRKNDKSLAKSSRTPSKARGRSSRCQDEEEDKSRSSCSSYEEKGREPTSLCRVGTHTLLCRRPPSLLAGFTVGPVRGPLLWACWVGAPLGPACAWWLGPCWALPAPASGPGLGPC